MDIRNNQIDLTDQDLEQVTGGSTIGFANASSSAGAGGPFGPAAGGQISAYDSGDRFGFSFANNQSSAYQFTGPGTSNSGAYNTGSGAAFGF